MNVLLTAIASAALLSACAASPPASNTTQTTVQLNVNITSTQPHAPKSVTRGAESGVPQRVGFYYSVNPDCSSDGLVRTTIKSAPLHGSVKFIDADGYTSFPPSSSSRECNTKKSPGVEVVYTSATGYVGTDRFTVQGIGPKGVYLETDCVVTVIAHGGNG